MEKSQIPSVSPWGRQLGMVVHTPERRSPPPKALATLLGIRPQLLWHRGPRSYEDLTSEVELRP